MDSCSVPELAVVYQWLPLYRRSSHSDAGVYVSMWPANPNSLGTDYDKLHVLTHDLQTQLDDSILIHEKKNANH